MNLDPLLDSLRTARAALQAEIDTLADQAAALDRHTPNTAPPEPTPAPVDNARRAFSPDDATALLEAM